MQSRLKASILAAPPPVDGTPGPDRHLEGTAGADLIRGLAGNDRLYGLGGGDTLDGGGGSDRLFGGLGNDRLIVTIGSDSVYGGGGVDTLDASKLGFGVTVNARSTSQGFPEIPANSMTLGNGNVQFVGSVENFIGSRFGDEFYAADGNWKLTGGLGNDTLHSGHGDTHLYGGAGNDALDAWDGSNTLFGGTGDDYLEGGVNNSTLFGGAGNDRLTVGSDNFPGVTHAYGGACNDRLDIRDASGFAFGGSGADTFYFGSSSGDVNDFQTGIDFCDLRVPLAGEHGTATFEQIRSMMTAQDGGTKLLFDFNSHSGFYVFFAGVSPDDFSARDFILN